MGANAGFGVLGVAWARRSVLLTGVGTAALLAGAGAQAAEFTASTAAELQAAVVAANAHADASSTIVLTGDIPVTGMLASLQKDLTIDTQGHTLGNVSLATTNGKTLTVLGTVVGDGAADALQTNTNVDSVIVNYATVTGGSGRNGAGIFSGQLTNFGTIKGGANNAQNGFGVSVRGGSQLINRGTVEGGSLANGNGIAAVDLSGGAGGANSLENYGTIRGGAGTLGGVGVLVRNNVAGIQPVTNHAGGLIEGGTGAEAIRASSAAVPLNIINSGTIRAGAGQANAIGFTSAATTGTITLELRAGSIIEGNVVANANAGFVDTLRLGGDGFDSFDVSAIGTQYLNFDALQKVGAGTWALTGSGTHTQPWEIVAGTLRIGDGETDGSIVSDVLNNSTLEFNNLGTWTYDGVISGSGGVNQIGTGTTILTGTSTYGGATNVYAGTLDIEGDLSALTGLATIYGGTLTVNGTLGGLLDVRGGRLQGTGSVGDTHNYAGGIIAPGNSIGVLTVDGDYTSDGGVLEIEAVLGDDSSPADLLLITGNSLLGLAPTLVNVVNVGGLGAETTGDGIKIVDVQGLVSDAGAFVLNGPAIGGAYSYKLFQNDLATGLDGDWYLRADALAPTTPTFENYPVALLGMIDLPTLRQRVGDRTEAADGIWTRIEGAAGHYEASDSSTAASYDSTLFLAQIGLERPIFADAGGSLVAGLTAQYSTNSADVTSSFGDGRNATESLGIGASLTWRGTEGGYADLQAQFASFSTDLDAIGYSLVEDNAGSGFAVSLEVGHEVQLDEAWSITPQAQLSYASVSFDSFTDAFGSEISLESGDSLVGRLGLAVDYRTDWQDGDGLKASSALYGIGNLTYEFLDGAAVVVSGTGLNYAGQKFGAELGLGGTIEWADGAQSLHGELLGSSSFEGSYAVKGTLGFSGRF